MKTKPHPYQQKGIWMIENRFHGRALLADEMGLGKTPQALWWQRIYHKDALTIVICPASLKWNWQREAMIHLGVKAKVLGSRTIPDTTEYLKMKSILIINYDVLWWWVEFLRSLDPGVVIVDECHNIKNPRSKRSRAVKALCKDVDKKLFLSGTPLTNRPAELYPTLNILRPDKYNSFFTFARKYCDLKRKPWGWEHNGAVNLEELHSELKETLMIRRKKSQVLRQLPKKNRSVIPVRLESTASSDYQRLRDDIKTWLNRFYFATKTKKNWNVMRAQALARMNALKMFVGFVKKDIVKDWIDNFLEESGEKLLVFGIHKALLNHLHDSYSGSVLVTGDITGEKRQHQFDAFNKDKNVRILFGNIKAAGEGWSCSSASNVMFAEMGWTPGEHTQAEDRVHGIKRGQEGVVSSSYYLVARDTIEEDLCSMIQKKQMVSDSILDGRPLNDSINIFDQLTQLLRKG